MDRNQQQTLAHVRLKTLIHPFLTFQLFPPAVTLTGGRKQFVCDVEAVTFGAPH